MSDEVLDIDRIDARLEKIEATLNRLCSLAESVMEDGLLMKSPTSGMFSATSTEDVSDVLSSIKDGLFNVASSDDDQTMGGLQSLISQLTDAKAKLNEIGASMSQTDEGSDIIANE